MKKELTQKIKYHTCNIEVVTIDKETKFISEINIIDLTHPEDDFLKLKLEADKSKYNPEFNIHSAQGHAMDTAINYTRAAFVNQLEVY